MSGNLVNRLIFLGGVIIIAMLLTQTYILLKTWDIKDQEFDQSVRIMLRKTAERLSEFQDADLPKVGLIKRTSSNYYAVNINSNIDANVLEDYLIQEMGNHSIKADFEYGVYDCHSKDLVYGNYCKISGSDENHTIEAHNLPTFNDLDYYFVVSFPGRESYLLSNMNMAILFSIISILSVLFFIYTMYIIIRQKRLSELQKDFINNMTHEFKTPISSIKIASDFMANHDSIKGNDRLNRYAEIIQQQNSRLNDQVEKVLNLAKLEKDSFELKRERITIAEKMNNIIHAENLKHKNATIEVEYNPDNLLIDADPLHFSNIISTLLDNAIKYSKEEPYVKVQCKKQDNGAIHISIEDRGVGISDEDQSKIFDKFYRVSTGNKHDVKGFGLGLFYVKNVVQGHGWQIKVDSELGKGSIFKIIIPKDE